MKKVAKNSLFFTAASSLIESGGEMHHLSKQQELYYRLLDLALIKGLSKAQSCEIGNKLIAMADHALDMRRTEEAERISEILINAPLPREYEQIGRYYQAMCAMRHGDYPESRAMLECVAEASSMPLKYRARALQALAANYHDSGKSNEALRFCLEAANTALLRHGHDLFASATSQWMVAMLKSIDGDHWGALEDIESLFPFVQMLAMDRPFYLYSYRNSLALELAEAGRIEEAQHNCRIILSSPLAHLNPEWSETAEEVDEKARRASHSLVAISSIASESAAHVNSGNLDQSSSASTTDRETDARKLAVISSSLPVQIASRRRMRNLPPDDKLSHIAKLVRDLGLCDPALYPAEEGDSPCRDQSDKAEKPGLIDIESQSDLERIITLWANHEITPEEFAAVLLTMADCKDYFRFEGVSLRMAKYAFAESDDSTRSEQEWRRKVAREIDLESIDLEKTIRLWFMGNITPDQLGSVIVQLDACTDADKRSQIIDRLVHCAFLEADKSEKMSEESWRRKIKTLIKPIVNLTA